MNGYNDCIGQTDVKDHLRKAVSRGRVSHAYILSGAGGMGKSALARAFAKTLQCLAGWDEPCGACVSCRAFDSGNHPDVFFVGLTGRKSLGVDDVREKIISEMETRPYSYRYKVFIVDSAETLTPEAQNALLKTVEEPAPYGVFLFLSTNPALFLPTMRSRCVLLKLAPVPGSAVENLLLASGVTQEKAAFLSAYAQGNPGLALRLAESEDFMEIRDEVTAAAMEIHNLDCAEALSRFPVFEKYRDRFGEVLDILLLNYRDEIVNGEIRGRDGAAHDKNGASGRRALQTAVSDGVAGLGRQTCRELLQKFYAVLYAKRALAMNANFQMAVEVMLMKLSEGDVETGLSC